VDLAREPPHVLDLLRCFARLLRWQNQARAALAGRGLRCYERCDASRALQVGRCWRSERCAQLCPAALAA
jgi:hypothetical protein